VGASTILEAWLEALADNQTEFGPLRQSTVNEVGPVPAVASDRPEVFTISDDMYIDAAAYTEARIVTGLEFKHNRLIVEREEARKIKDEDTMIRKEDEARFWSDVSAWVKSHGTARKMPDPIPSWLAQLNPVYNP
jgi:hypothetical protein